MEMTPPRTIITTDPELDDLNSMLRMLLYANELNIAGLVYSSSQFHHAGDPERGIAPHRWPDPDDRFHIDIAVDAYEKAHANLVVHDPRYPAPEDLRSLIAWGNVKNVGEMDEVTAGSELICRVLLDDEPGRVFLQVWGGPNTIARALRSIEEEFAGTADWDQVHQKVSRKAVITSFGQQDDTFTTYIRPNWPGIEHREVATHVWGYFARAVVDSSELRKLGPEWTRDHVSKVGPMGAEYRVWGDGKQMAVGFDDEDYFGFADRTSEELEELGYQVWTPPEPAGSWISEGDSSNFALLVDNGLRSWEHPGWGGWGGRQVVSMTDPNAWSNHGARDLDLAGQPNEQWTSARWFGAFQNDFAARLRWTVTDAIEAANHHPVAEVAEGLDLKCRPGEHVTLTGTATDPDGDGVTLHWWQYREAGTSPLELVLDQAGGAVSFQIPAEAEPGHTFHLILEATDDGTPPLTHWQRVVITTSPPVS